MLLLLEHEVHTLSTTILNSRMDSALSGNIHLDTLALAAILKHDLLRLGLTGKVQEAGTLVHPYRIYVHHFVHPPRLVEVPHVGH